MWQSHPLWTADSLGDKHNALHDPMVMVGAPASLPKSGSNSSKEKARVTDRVSKICNTNGNLSHSISLIQLGFLTFAFQFSNVGNVSLITSKPYMNCFQIEQR